MKFQILASREIKEAYAIREENGKVFVRFNKNGKEYAYAANNIQILDEEEFLNQDKIVLYRFNSECYKRKKQFEVLTYIVFNDGTNENVIFPWNKERLLKHQNVAAHLQDPSIEYYGLEVLGNDDLLDEFFMNKFPKRLQKRYSNTTKTTYVANICPHCGSMKGWYYLYYEINQKIKNMQSIQTVDYVD